jgi:hypothetical protein
MGIEDAITWVRGNHCHKAVESQAQIEWLHKHYGITKVKPTKTAYQGGNDLGGDLFKPAPKKSKGKKTGGGKVVHMPGSGLNPPKTTKTGTVVNKDRVYKHGYHVGCILSGCEVVHGNN